jgi:hypothetical protein
VTILLNIPTKFKFFSDYKFIKMCLKYRMSTNSLNMPKNTNSGVNKSNSGKANSTQGFFSGLLNAAKNVTKKATNAVTGNKPNAKKNVAPVITPVPAPVAPVTAGVNVTMKGGAASVNFSIPYGQRQPSEQVMEWATTADAPKPTGSQMRNVAHGGKRRTHRKRSTHRRKTTHRRRSCGGKKHSHSMKRKTHRKRSSRHHKRRN